MSKVSRLFFPQRRRGTLARPGIGALALLVVVSTATTLVTATASPAVAASASGGSQAPLGGPTDAKWSTGATSGTPTNPSVQNQAQQQILGSGELSSLRTRWSDTFTTGSALRTQFSTLPVNYQSAGVWKPIDDSLVAGDGGVLGVKADDYQVALPVLAAAPVVTGYGALTVSSVLSGAAPVAPKVSGQTATYDSVFPGVEEVLTTRPDALEQSFVLAAPDSQSATTL